MAAEVSMERTAAVYDPRRQALRRVLRNRKAVFGMIFLSIIILSAVLAPWISPHDPYRQDLRNRLQGSSSEHWLGTDHLGRDLFTRIVYGGRVSLRVGFFSVGIALLIGGTMGLLGGYFGGWLDTLVMRIVDMLLAMPGFLLALAIVYAWIVHDQRDDRRGHRVRPAGPVTIRRHGRAGVRVRVGGPGRRRRRLRIMFRILPNSWDRLSSVHFDHGGRDFVQRLSASSAWAQPPTAKWGAMLSAARSFIRVHHAVTYPGLAIMLTVLSLNMLGDGLRDAFDPRMRS